MKLVLLHGRCDGYQIPEIVHGAPLRMAAERGAPSSESVFFDGPRWIDFVRYMFSS
jgi:hypothetical protein